MRSWKVLLIGFFVAACSEGSPPGSGDDDSSPDSGVAGAESACDDGVDNDGDSLTDCDDPDCDSVCKVEVICDDGLDGDGDLLVDCRDPDCDGVGGCEHGNEVSCGDGIDNDGDAALDCIDADCAFADNCGPEAICDDGVDQDQDGMADCLDQDCDGNGICEYNREASCGDSEDNDGDGDTDCDDSDCGGDVACLFVCPGTSTPVQLTGAALPVAITDNATFRVTATGTGVGVVTKALVQTSITHTFDGDLQLVLESPTGTRRILSDRHGSLDDNYTDTIFVDGAATPIASGTAPFTGSFAPDESLDAFIGAALAGDWIFEVSDNAGGDTGSITDVTIHLCVCDGCELGPACADGVDNDMDGDTDCADTDCAAAVQCSPEPDCNDNLDNDLDGDIDCADSDCVADPACLPETVCDDVIDNDFDGLTDCLDSDCGGVGICEFGAEATCADTEDNDGDSLTDCLDSDCDTVGVCEFGAELTCGDTEDNDGDGATDCADADCAADAACIPEVDCTDGVDNDMDGLADCMDPGCAPELVCITTCPAGDTTVNLSATDLPIAITDNATFTSNIVVATAGIVTRAVVGFSATHTFDGDLDISLISPAATSIDLSSDNGSLDDNYTGTIFADAAPTSIVNGTAPFTGLFQPESPLSAVNGEASAGTWQLQVVDDAGGDTGSFTDFDLILCLAP